MKKEMESIPIPKFKGLSVFKREQLFIKMLRQCCTLFDFRNTNNNDDLEWMKLKENILLKMFEYMHSNQCVISDNIYPEMMKMISVNLFRTLPPPNSSNGTEFKPKNKLFRYQDMSQLQLVYKIFQKFLEFPNFKISIAQPFINQQFVLQLLELFNSAFPFEREYLKMILHCIYKKCLDLRTFIRREITFIFYRFIYETEYYNGTAELLEFLSSIISGFNVPLKYGHKLLLSKILMPLHTMQSLSLYHSQLLHCVILFLEKEPQLAEQAIMSLLKFWPKINSEKEILFLTEIGNILNIIRSSQFQRIMVPLFGQIAKCLSSLNYRVVEKALYLWSFPRIAELITQKSKTILPILYPSLYQNINSFWNETIRLKLYSLFKWFMETDLDSFHKRENNVRQKQIKMNTLHLV